MPYLAFSIISFGRYYVLRNNVVEKVLRLTRRREKYLVVAAIRFLRTCIGLKDDFYARYLVKNNLFAPVMDAFKANGDKYNMLNSAVIELVDYVRKVSTKVVVSANAEWQWKRQRRVEERKHFAHLL